MGLLDSIEGLAGGAGGQAGQQGGVAQALIQTATQHPGGLEGILNGFRQNGMDQHVNSWVNPGENQSITPDQVQQGMGSSMLGEVAQRAGVSPQVAQMALATVLPMVVSHFSRNGQVAPQSELGSLASSFFGNHG
ncbi:MAG TPA: YidB family protein [Acidisarcina sp.]